MPWQIQISVFLAFGAARVDAVGDWDVRGARRVMPVCDGRLVAPVATAAVRFAECHHRRTGLRRGGGRRHASSGFSECKFVNKITKQELWVDGLLAYVATMCERQGQKDFAATLLWTPKSGQHTLVVRVLDVCDNVGTSPVVRVKVIDGGKRATPGSFANRQAGRHDSFDCPRERVTPDQLRQANPGLPDPPPPGDWVNIPPGNNQEGGNDDQPGGAVNDPGAAPIPPGWTLSSKSESRLSRILDHPCRSGRRQRTLRCLCRS